MSGLPKKEYEINGETFTVKPTTVANRKRIEAYLENSRQEILQNVELAEKRLEREIAIRQSKEDPSIEIPPEIEMSDRDDYQTAFDLFKLLTDGPHEVLVFEEFDIAYARDALENFLMSAAGIGSTLATLPS
jgi:hypothetical protein